MNVFPALLIDPVRVNALLGQARGRFEVEAIAECASTNTLLLERAEEGAASGRVIVADRQTAGRGSRGRSWLAAPQASLTFSVLWRFPGGLERLAGLSLAVGVAVVRALEDCGAQGVRLKWPNDILHEDGKLGGILVELQGVHSEPEEALAVIGIGLNLSRPPELPGGEGFALKPAALDQLLDPLPERDLLFARLLGELAVAFDAFASGGFAALRTEWQARNAWQDAPVRVLREGRVEGEGLCRGADNDGALLLETPGGLVRCLSGDVSLRVAC